MMWLKFRFSVLIKRVSLTEVLTGLKVSELKYQASIFAFCLFSVISKQKAVKSYPFFWIYFSYLFIV